MSVGRIEPTPNWSEANALTIALRPILKLILVGESKKQIDMFISANAQVQKMFNEPAKDGHGPVRNENWGLFFVMITILIMGIIFGIYWTTNQA